MFGALDEKLALATSAEFSEERRKLLSLMAKSEGVGMTAEDIATFLLAPHLAALVDRYGLAWTATAILGIGGELERLSR